MTVKTPAHAQPQLREAIGKRLWELLKKETGKDWRIDIDHDKWYTRYICNIPDIVMRRIATETKDLTQYNFGNVEEIAEEHARLILYFYRKQQ